MAEISRNNTDGRVARGERTRAAIVVAHTELVRSGVLKPTGKAVADRAGISPRTLWLNFKDLEALLEATTSYWLDTDAHLRREVDPSLPQPERIDAYCAQRVERLEHIAPAARSAALGEPFSPALQASRRSHIRRSLDDLELAFASELAAAADDREVLLNGMFVVTGWPSWTILRDDFGLSVEAARSVMHRAMAALLAT